MVQKSTRQGGANESDRACHKHTHCQRPSLRKGSLRVRELQRPMAMPKEATMLMPSCVPFFVSRDKLEVFPRSNK
jgi:hypothetical protein